MPDNEPIAWSQLTANQRNALIAEHIFGRKVVAWKADRDMLLQRAGAEGHESIPRYSESMDEAWKVLQRLQGICAAKQGRTYDFYLSELGFHINPWRNPIDGAEMFTLRELVALTPERICIAALKVLGLTIEIEEKQ